MLQINNLTLTHIKDLNNLTEGFNLTLNKGDLIYLYTDGVTEATDSASQLFGMERLEASLNKVKDKEVTEILKSVKADIDEFVNVAPQFDDITMLCLEYKQYKK